jgi:hypothetical protein
MAIGMVEGAGGMGDRANALLRLLAYQPRRND